MAGAQMPVHHKAGQAYSYRLPTPPRIVVPPPTLVTEFPTLSIGQGQSTPQEEVETSFLKEYNLDDIVQRNVLLEWAYERRRQAQMILPWLWLGPMAAAKDEQFLQREGFTMSLAVRTKINSLTGGLKTAQKLSMDVCAIDAADSFGLIRMFSPAAKLINHHMAQVRRISTTNSMLRAGKVLVFCESGNEKSAAIVAAYLMEIMDNFDFVKAMQVVQAQRFCVNFDDTLKKLLQAHWDILSARRAVADDRSQLLDSSTVRNGLHGIQEQLNGANVVQNQKRPIDQTIEDEDMDMNDGMDPSDRLRFTGRDNTPFRDA
jgi:serine/threonine/tyrosine-interacting protein